MNPLSRLAVAGTTLLLPLAAVTGTAYAKLPPEPGPRSGAPVTETPAPIIQTTGLATWQVIALVALAVAVTAVLTVIATHRLPKLHPPYAKSAV
ncbi:hypothetical protein [Kribbella sp. NPDC051770]|uniref:hypothetical protein n=1 Tax=Kribbella sp. NPDC051770 TaxID=3155413 RepID=UPI003413A75E